MVVLLVQISVNLSVLKGWGLHPLDEFATLAEVLEQFKHGEIEGCSSFVFPNALLEQLFECYKHDWAVLDSFSLCQGWGNPRV